MKYCWKCNEWKDTVDEFCDDCGSKLKDPQEFDITAFEYKGKKYNFEKIADILKRGKWDLANQSLINQVGFSSGEAREICRFLKKYNDLERLEEEKKQKEFAKLDAQHRTEYLRKDIQSKVDRIVQEGGESLYEYKVLSLVDKNTGACDIEALEAMLNEYAKKGWRVKSVITNELGKTALAIMGIGINGTVDQVIAILERDIRLSLL